MLSIERAGWSQANAVIAEEAAVTPVSLGRGIFHHFCGLDSVPILSMFGHDSAVIVFSLDPS